MVKSVIAEDHLLSYIHDLRDDNPFSIGLILGQVCSDKCYVIHLAKTSFVDEGKNELRLISKLEDVNELDVTEHALQTSKMLPGGISIVGIFVVSQKDVLNPFMPKLKSILQKIQKRLETDPCSEIFGNNEKIVFNMCSETNKYLAKAYNMQTSQIKPTDFKFFTNPVKWSVLSCKYVLNQTHYISEKEQKEFELKKYLQAILSNISESLNTSLFSYNGSIREDTNTLEVLEKERKNVENIGDNIQQNSIPVTILQKSVAQSQIIDLKENEYSLKIIGEVASKVWLHPKLSIKETKSAIIQDILRSLATRLEMHWDSLVEEQREEFSSIHEPPRRVLVNLPHSDVAISDYLFPGEGPDDVKFSIQELFDFKVKDIKGEIQDLEGQADVLKYCETEAAGGDSLEIERKNSKSMLWFMVGSTAAFLMLLLALLIHFLLK